MSTFKDSKDLEWELPTIDAFLIMRVRRESDAKFLLNDTEDDNTADRLRNDPVLLCQVIYVLCEKQRKARELDDPTFYQQVIGGAIDRATAALIEAIDFFIPERTKALFAVVNAQDKVLQTVIQKAGVAASDPELIAGIEKEADAALAKAVTRLRSVSS